MVCGRTMMMTPRVARVAIICIIVHLHHPRRARGAARPGLVLSAPRGGRGVRAEPLVTKHTRCARRRAARATPGDGGHADIA